MLGSPCSEDRQLSPKPEVIKDEFCFVDGLLLQFLACVCVSEFIFFLLDVRHAFHYVCVDFLFWGENEVFLTKVS